MLREKYDLDEKIELPPIRRSALLKINMLELGADGSQGSHQPFIISYVNECELVEKYLQRLWLDFYDFNWILRTMIFEYISCKISLSFVLHFTMMGRV